MNVQPLSELLTPEKLEDFKLELAENGLDTEGSGDQEYIVFSAETLRCFVTDLEDYFVPFEDEQILYAL